MKRFAVVLTTILAFAALASLASCEGGVFIDPGHEAVYGFGSGSGDGSFSLKPSYLSNNASLDDAYDKLDKIYEYCENHPGTINEGIMLSIDALVGGTLNYINENSWSAAAQGIILTINGMIDSLQ
jgi:hypothetical protein